MKDKSFLCIGINYKNCSIEIRERISVKEENYSDFLGRTMEMADMHEALILSTCNRTEFYCITGTENENSIIEKVKGLFLSEFSIGFNASQYFYIYKTEEAMNHLFTVVAGLDSMILGEPQIAGQVKRAYEKSKELGGVGTYLNTIFSKSFSINKYIKSNTKIGVGAVSVAFAAIELAKKIFHPLSTKKVLSIGTGEMGQLIVKHLQNNQVKDCFITGRRHEKTVTIAESLNVNPVTLTDALTNFDFYDIITVAASADSYVLTSENVVKKLKTRKKPTLIIDISLPRMVDPEIGTTDNLFLYNVDDLKKIVEFNALKRREELELARSYIENESLKVISQLKSLDLSPVIVKLRDKFEIIRKEEISKFSGKFKNLDENNIELINEISRRYMNALLHFPLSNLKKNVEDERVIEYLNSLNNLFEL